jgi:hypothetical protein
MPYTENIEYRLMMAHSYDQVRKILGIDNFISLKWTKLAFRQECRFFDRDQ